jgi:hypothetical protein
MSEYKRSDKPVPPISWNEYLVNASRQWELLLSSPNIDEKEIHTFLENNPSLIPGAYGISFTSGHDPLYGAVFSQPILPGIETKYPDFMWIAINSSEISPILIEIEALDKPWFTKEGHQRAEFTQAENQLDQWRVWFSEPRNILNFQKLYLQRLPIKQDMNIIPHYVLIYGRRKDVEPYHNLRSVHRKSDETQMTYDRLSFSEDQSNYVTVKMKNENIYIISFPPNCMIGSGVIPHWKYFKNLPQYFSEAPGISQKRKDFLVERFNYCKEWDDSPGVHMICVGDLE